MKKIIVILLALIGFSLSTYAQASCAVVLNGQTIGSVTAWTEGGSLWASNDTDRQVTVTIEVEGGQTYTVVLPPAPRGQSVRPTQVRRGVYARVVRVYNAICT
jgi:P pilus assembly chaperone PapD